MKFVGDSDGLSDRAVFRRSENMLNGALKYATTEHMLPHERQVKGEAGAHPLKWTDSHLQNVSNLLETVHKNVLKQVPEIAHFRYNMKHGRFERSTSKGQYRRVGEKAFQELADTPGAKAAGIGSTSLKRAALVNTLLRGDGQEVRDGVLPADAQLGGAERRQGSQSAPQIEGTPLAKIGYSKTHEPRSGGVSASGADEAAARITRTQQIADHVTKKWANKPDITVIHGMDDPKAPQAARAPNLSATVMTGFNEAPACWPGKQAVKWRVGSVLAELQ